MGFYVFWFFFIVKTVDVPALNKNIVDEENSMRVAICDDEKLHLEHTKNALEEAYKSLDLLVDVYSDGKVLLERMSKIRYDLVILDIEMPEMNGIETARRLRAFSEKTAIVFLTSHIEYALEGYEVSALRYLTKPASVEKLSEIITYLVEREKKTKKLFIRDVEDMVTVNVSDILYMEAQNQNIRIVTVQGIYKCRYNLADYDRELSAYGFFRIHRSYLVNLAHVIRISGKEVYMADGAHLPVSRTREKQFCEALYQYVKEEAL